MKRDIPSLLDGIEIAIPSGKFWIPIPIARAIAEAIEEVGKSETTAPKATPTTKPSVEYYAMLLQE